MHWNGQAGVVALTYMPFGGVGPGQQKGGGCTTRSLERRQRRSGHKLLIHVPSSWRDVPRESHYYKRSLKFPSSGIPEAAP